MENLERSEIYTTINGIIQYCFEKGIEDEETIWEVVCDETDTDYEDYEGDVGVIFDELFKEWNLNY